MCGIAGFVEFQPKSNEAQLEAMIAPLHHRGPDGHATQLWRGKTHVGFAHARLSIIDLSETGTQPMSFGKLHITFNGEIYNHEEIRSELIALGHQFIGSSDTEMILHAYATWGIQCVEKFIGMFAIVLYDENKNEITCIRDRAGVKPFFYYWKNDVFLFASELKAFHQYPDFEKELNLDAVSAFMQYGNVPTPHCIFNSCWKLKPGHYLKLDLNSKALAETCYWNVTDFYNQPRVDLSYAEAKTKTKDLLISACNYRMVADVPVGVFLSGGFDSSAVTALLQSERTEKLKTFTIGVPDMGLNEAPYAKDIAAHLGTDHNECYCSSQEAMDLIPTLPYYFDEPFADSSAIPTMLVSKMAREQVTVALSADGGDETFAGYNRYEYMLRYGKKLNAIPGFARKSIVGMMNAIPSERIPILKNKYNFHNRYEKLKGVLRNPSEKDIMLSLSQQFTNDQIQKILAVQTEELQSYYHSKEIDLNVNSPLSYMMAVDYQTYMLDDILQKVDRATMTASLEGREPLLDHRIIEFAATLPDAFKYHDGVKKRILRDIVYDFVPKELLDRPKMGFAIPIADWMLTELKDLVHSYIDKKTIVKQGIFDWDEIEKLMRAFYGGKKEYGMKIWYLLMFQMWYAKWMTSGE